MSNVTINAEIKLRTDQMLQELRKLPGVTETEVKAMTSAVRREYGRQVKEAEKAAKASAKAWKEGTDAIKGSAEKLGSMLGGPFGDVADLALDLGEKLSGTAGVLGAMGATSAVVAAGFAAVGVSIKGIADAALEASHRLQEQGRDAEIPPAALASLRDYEQATTDLRAEVDLLTVSIGAPLADAMTTVVDVSRDLIARWGELSSAAQGVATYAQGVTRALVAFGSLGLSEVALDYAASVRQEANAHRDAEQAAADQAEMLAALGMTTEDSAGSAQRATSAHREQAASIRDTAAAAERLAEQAAKLERISEDLTSQTEDLTVNMGTAAMVIDTTGAELPAVTTQWQRASQAVQEFAARANELTQSAGFTASVGALQDLGELQSVLHEQSVAELQQRIDRRRQEIEEFRDGELQRIDALVRSGAISGKEAATRRQEVYAEAQARREAMRQRTADERDAALRSFRAGQALAVSSAIIDAAAAALALIPAFLFLGPLAPVGAATASGLALATQLAVIRQQKPPEFPMGRLPTSSDHTQLAALQPSEAVLTQRGVATLGGPATVQAANDGRGMMGGRMYLQLDRRTLAEVVVETGRTATVDPRRGKIDPWRG